MDEWMIVMATLQFSHMYIQVLLFSGLPPGLPFFYLVSLPLFSASPPSI